MRLGVNFLWLGLRFPAKDDAFVQPIPEWTFENMAEWTALNPDVTCKLWVDRKRLSDQQWAYFEQKTAETGGVILKNLRDYSRYGALYDREETNPYWCDDKHSLIWRQVDAAKILTTLLEPQDAEFFADLDIQPRCLNAVELIEPIKKYGVVAGRGNSDASGFENQFFGFSAAEMRRPDTFLSRHFIASKTPLAELLYGRTCRDGVEKRKNGYNAFIDTLEEHATQLNISRDVFSVRTPYKGDCATHAAVAFKTGLDQEFTGVANIPAFEYKPPKYEFSEFGIPDDWGRKIPLMFLKGLTKT